MIDLADIRKKARQEKEAPAADQPDAPSSSSGRSRSSVQGVPAAPASKGDFSDGATPPAAEASAVDSLERLFAQVADVQLATEEIYFQGLSGAGEQVAEKRREWLTFSLGKEEYALDIEGVSEIIKPRMISEIPRVPGFILGIMSLRGVIIPIFDLKQQLRLGKVEESAGNRIIVCQHEDMIAGLLVDKISQVVRIAERNIEPPPHMMPDLDVDLVEGVGRHQGNFLILLNLVGILNAGKSSR